MSLRLLRSVAVQTRRLATHNRRAFKGLSRPLDSSFLIHHPLPVKLAKEVATRETDPEWWTEYVEQAAFLILQTDRNLTPDECRRLCHSFQVHYPAACGCTLWRSAWWDGGSLTVYLGPGGKGEGVLHFRIKSER